MNTNNMKSTWPTPAPRFGDLTFAGGIKAALGVTQIFASALGVTQILAFLDTNMLVYQTRNCGVGGQRKDPKRMVLHRSVI